MKASTSKAVPSPGRANKYPPPLMRFLRSNAGSRSRGRSSRATVHRKRTTAIDAQQEPSSPKVTCIGQVRVRRSSSKSKPALKKRKSTAARNRFCCRVGQPPALCNSFHISLCCQSGCFRPRWRKWISFFHCRKIRVRTDSSKKESNPTVDGDGDEEEERRRGEGEEEEEEERNSDARESYCRVYGSDSSGSPPKNALILARCRSAPHRSSYLASLLWGSPLKTEEQETGEQENRESAAEEELKDLGSLEIEQITKNTVQEEKANLEICKEITEAEQVGEISTITPTTPNPYAVEKPGLLRRSKSEPARRSGDPLTASFWTERRMESSLSSSAHCVDNE